MSKVISIMSYIQDKLSKGAWEEQIPQDYLKDKMDPEEVTRDLRGVMEKDRYPHYRSWIVNSGLELLRIEGTTGIFKVKAMFYADRLVQQQKYVKALLDTLKTLNPIINSFKIYSPEDERARIKYAAYKTR